MLTQRPILLITGRLIAHDRLVEQSEHQNATVDESSNDDDGSTVSVNHFPARVVGGAVSAPQTTPRNVLTGLLAAPDKIGPKGAFAQIKPK